MVKQFYYEDPTHYRNEVLNEIGYHKMYLMTHIPYKKLSK